VILFDGTATDPIQRVPASGGVPVVLVKPDATRKEVQIGWPEFLPDGKHFLYMAMTDKAADSKYRIASLETKENRPFAPAQSLVTYVEPGYLLYLRDRTLVAQPFDARALKTTGEPIPLAEGVGTDSVGLARFSVSREGTLAYRTGEVNDRLIWVDRTGKELEALGDPAQYHDPLVSPDGRRLAFEIIDPRSGRYVIWIRDLARGVNSRFSFSDGDAFAPVWSPDSKHIAWVTEKDKFDEIYLYDASENSNVRLTQSSGEWYKHPSFSPDGSHIAFWSNLGNLNYKQIWTMKLDGSGKVNLSGNSFNDWDPIWVK